MSPSQHVLPLPYLAATISLPKNRKVLNFLLRFTLSDPITRWTDVAHLHEASTQGLGLQVKTANGFFGAINSLTSALWRKRIQPVTTNISGRNEDPSTLCSRDADRSRFETRRSLEWMCQTLENHGAARRHSQHQHAQRGHMTKILMHYFLQHVSSNAEGSQRTKEGKRTLVVVMNSTIKNETVPLQQPGLSRLKHVKMEQ